MHDDEVRGRVTEMIAHQSADKKSLSLNFVWFVFWLFFFWKSLMQRSSCQTKQQVLLCTQLLQSQPENPRQRYLSTPCVCCVSCLFTDWNDIPLFPAASAAAGTSHRPGLPKMCREPLYFVVRACSKCNFSQLEVSSQPITRHQHDAFSDCWFLGIFIHNQLHGSTENSPKKDKLGYIVIMTRLFDCFIKDLYFPHSNVCNHEECLGWSHKGMLIYFIFLVSLEF